MRSPVSGTDVTTISSSEDYPTSAHVDIEKWREGRVSSVRDVVAEEVPIALEYNGISHVVMMASPADLEDFALGFSLTEGILADPGELFGCEIVGAADGIQVQMEIASQRFMALKEKRRNLTGRTGCGLCGAETLAQAIRKPPPVASDAQFTAVALHKAIEQMQQQQQLQQATGATHAAAWVRKNGDVVLVREDVGRHNALDKLIGALAADKEDFSSGAVLITSRASYEMVQKAATMGIGLVAAISAPTALAIRLAQEANVTLLGFMRQSSHAVYANGHRLLIE
ncbi:formate dehydrogenase accessory sulfurtransferase FdhD [Glaciimonas sp. CA11.2]|uniref:formate dehydrogenase accessory sulfurtransferase FdhD n=1 Tax=Glaciimonas sp. CA11.2 TaxID=3048601 RepID=UPI002AB32A69|nr:formate dehydrogenase accessory sulfurtransferase FdhD [Glaciimonas sp. CA11.2]MDY7545202.1 formate dehydrogenase accessory sulfurtransferase FdhD [Glaciimonas sp. CA11.2]MEB0162445.1 formate dehydrogenase accessory sulfurtransferase FdhD [Glaciimonas sp. CA11.2]